MNIELTKEQAAAFNRGESITLYAPATEATVTGYGGGISFHSGKRDAYPLITISIPFCNIVGDL
jgi:hypothetical protein